mmetsp:Transcript_20852/g.64638  ORF Transcript_20852/g.64638 Transcript_20852/m.64638 type:complete len:475 (-) Transcript_20852:353-1777(-)
MCLSSDGTDRRSRGGTRDDERYDHSVDGVHLLLADDAHLEVVRVEQKCRVGGVEHQRGEEAQHHHRHEARQGGQHRALGRARVATVGLKGARRDGVDRVAEGERGKEGRGVEHGGRQPPHGVAGRKVALEHGGGLLARLPEGEPRYGRLNERELGEELDDVGHAGDKALAQARQQRGGAALARRLAPHVARRLPHDLNCGQHKGAEGHRAKAGPHGVAQRAQRGAARAGALRQVVPLRHRVGDGVNLQVVRHEDGPQRREADDGPRGRHPAVVAPVAAVDGGAPRVHTHAALLDDVGVPRGLASTRGDGGGGNVASQRGQQRQLDEYCGEGHTGVLTDGVARHAQQPRARLELRRPAAHQVHQQRRERQEEAAEDEPHDGARGEQRGAVGGAHARLKEQRHAHHEARRARHQHQKAQPQRERARGADQQPGAALLEEVVGVELHVVAERGEHAVRRAGALRAARQVGRARAGQR